LENDAGSSHGSSREINRVIAENSVQDSSEENRQKSPDDICQMSQGSTQDISQKYFGKNSKGWAEVSHQGAKSREVEAGVRNRKKAEEYYSLGSTHKNSQKSPEEIRQI
jgi:hypothetical protein